MKLAWSSDILQSETRTGSAKFWQGHVYLGEDGLSYIGSTSWQETKGGGTSAVLTATPKLAKPKNVGKANETTSEEQAYSEIQSKIKKQKDKGYRAPGEAASDRPLPMLAHSFDKRGHNIVWPCAIQPKLDGFRMLVRGTQAWTRKGIDHVAECVARIVDEIVELSIPKEWILDGELILEGMPPLQQTAAAAKKYNKDTSSLRYHIYDVITGDDSPFRLRSHWIKDTIGDVGSNIIYVPTFSVDNEATAREFHDAFVAEGFEGAILRNWDAAYHVGHRSPDLQKLKSFEDAEFTIVDVLEGEGSETGCAIFMCTIGPDLCQCKGCQESYGCVEPTFKVRPRGTVAMRREWFQQREELIGEQLTVRYSTLTDDGIPFHPVGVNVRED